VALNFGRVTKRADRLYVAPPHRLAGIKQGRLVIPLQNGGSGIALLLGKPVLVSTCDDAHFLIKRFKSGTPSYVVRSGEADQYGFFQPATPGGRLPNGGWYTFDYSRWGRSKRIHARRQTRRRTSPRHQSQRRRRAAQYKPCPGEVHPNVIVWYTDGARTELRWVCAQYVFVGVGRGGIQYAVTATNFGQGPA
jgi:hypothetical protein